jgi:hypothetical protein
MFYKYLCNYSAKNVVLFRKREGGLNLTEMAGSVT